MQPKVLVIDNYDSFTYNLVQYLAELGAEVEVLRNDALASDTCIDSIRNEIKPSHILISPGPGKPSSAGISLNIIRELKGEIPILGVCLGCQAIGEIYGAKVVHAPELMHGKTSEIYHKSSNPLFKGIPSPYTSTRYHSLVIDRESLEASPDLILEAWTDNDLVMAVSHVKYPNLVGVQYHPESILSQYGKELLGNFLEMS